MGQALFGLIGVAVGAFLGIFRDLLSDWRTRRRNARYLAIRIVCVLDKYVEDCAEVSTDDGLCHGQRDENGYLQAQVPYPAPPSFPQDLDWRSIEHNLMYRLLSIPNEAEAANSKIDFVEQQIAFPPDFEEFFEERQDQYSKLGLNAYALTEELRQQYGIPARQLEVWDPSEHLRKARKELEAARRRRTDQLAVLPPII